MDGNGWGRPSVGLGAYCRAAMGGRWPLLSSLRVRYFCDTDGPAGPARRPFS